MEVSGKRHSPAAFPQGKNTWYPPNRRLGGLLSRSGHFGKEKNLFFLPGLEPRILQHGRYVSYDIPVSNIAWMFEHNDFHVSC
jgi:hypothetical protein